MQRDGYRYGLLNVPWNTETPGFLLRYDAAGKPAPFPGMTDDKTWPAVRNGPGSHTEGWIRVNRQNDILVKTYSTTLAGAEKPEFRTWGLSSVDVFNPDGTVKQKDFIWGSRHGWFGFKVDRKGCIYMADHFLPFGRFAPGEVEAKAG